MFRSPNKCVPVATIKPSTCGLNAYACRARVFNDYKLQIGEVVRDPNDELPVELCRADR
jgi:hypothetical protein